MGEIQFTHQEGKKVGKSCYARPGRSQAIQLSKSRNKLLSTTYQPFFTSLYVGSSHLHLDELCSKAAFKFFGASSLEQILSGTKR